LRLLSTYAPLPKWKHLVRALFPMGEKTIEKPWYFGNELSGRLSRSAWSLALIALWRKKSTFKSEVTIWIPSFFCNASLAPLRAVGVNFIFYPVSEAMEPDSEECNILAVNSPPDIFLLVHYFGRPNRYNFAVKFAHDSGAWLVEDAAHALIPVDNIGKLGDFILYSPHKHLPIPDGAILVIRPTGPSQLPIGPGSIFDNPLTWPGQLKEVQRRMVDYAKINRFMSLMWITKRGLQKMGIRSQGSKALFAESLGGNSNNIPSTIEPPAQSLLGMRLLAMLSSEIDKIALVRIRNHEIWADFFSSRSELNNKIFNSDRGPKEKWTPYLAAYRGDSIAITKAYYFFQKHGIPVLTWPDLPPEVKSNKNSNTIAWELRHTYIYLPIHQSFNFSKLLLKNIN